ncbi:hypothetical protein PP352_25035 [Mycobacteroides abscessus]|nr:hypothetical protein [Mycobacteroides abscessus]
MATVSNVRQVLSAKAIGFEAPRSEGAIKEAEALGAELTARGWQLDEVKSGREHVAWTAPGNGGAQLTVAYRNEPADNGSFVDTVTVQVPVDINGTNSIHGYVLTMELLYGHLSQIEAHCPGRPFQIPGVPTFTLRDQPVQF